MPYQAIKDLPASVRKVLPNHAQEIYLAAFNRAWHKFEAQVDREMHAHRIAWGAVKKLYEKQDDRWVERSD